MRWRPRIYPSFHCSMTTMHAPRVSELQEPTSTGDLSDIEHRVAMADGQPEPLGLLELAELRRDTRPTEVASLTTGPAGFRIKAALQGAESCLETAHRT